MRNMPCSCVFRMYYTACGELTARPAGWFSDGHYGRFELAVVEQ